jgi:PPK2 family polyphosphate:nucleotide phosphotransferase
MHLKNIDPSDTGKLSKEEALRKTAELTEKIGDLQELLFAAGETPLLIVLQGRDTSGKDGTIRHLLTFMNAQSTRVEPFKVPTPLELSKDFLWRVHAKTPSKGETVIFNRSHYEDVLVVRVHEFVPEDVWRKRYDHINHFEKLLTDSGAIILKFMLHISKEEQEHRLLEREQEATKSWKLSVGDWKERELWDQYTDAYADVLENCSPKSAPWLVVSANEKWYRNYVITKALYDALKPYEDQWREKLAGLGSKMKAELEEFRKASK